MNLERKSFLFIVLSLALMLNQANSLLVFPETSEFYTFVELGLEFQHGESLPFFEVGLINLETLHVLSPLVTLEKTCPKAHRPAPERIYFGSPVNPQMCFAAKHPFGRYLSVGIFTHFYQIDTILISGSANGAQFEETLRLERLVPREMHNIVIPYTIEEGKAFYEPFDTQHLVRGLGFRHSMENYQFSIGSIPRSGTHAVHKNLEEITGEFIRTFPDIKFFDTEPHYLAGEIKSTKNMVTAAFLSHEINKWHQVFKITRQIILVRSPIFSAESHFHLIASMKVMMVKDHLCKIGGDYMSHPIYHRYMTERASFGSYILESRKRLFKSHSIPGIFIRYEDLTSNPTESLMLAISVYSGVPAEVSFKEKVDKFVKENGLVSFYRKDDKPQEKEIVKIAKLDKFPVNLVQVNYDKNENLLADFGYLEVYQERLGLPVTSSNYIDGVLAFEHQNKEVLEMIHKYKFNAFEMKNTLKEFNIPPRKEIYKEKDWLEILPKEFEDYPRTCFEEKR